MFYLWNGFTSNILMKIQKINATKVFDSIEWILHSLAVMIWPMIEWIQRLTHHRLEIIQILFEFCTESTWNLFFAHFSCIELWKKYIFLEIKSRVTYRVLYPEMVSTGKCSANIFFVKIGFGCISEKFEEFLIKSCPRKKFRCPSGARSKKDLVTTRMHLD